MAPEVSLREISKETLRDILSLKVAPEQEGFVASNAVSVAEAYFSRDVAWFRSIHAGETPVGFVMVEADEINRTYFLWRFMIDARYQGKGIGRRALALVLEHVRSRPGGRVLYLTCVPGEGGPGPFYERMGFSYTGEEKHGQLVMRRDL